MTNTSNPGRMSRYALATGTALLSAGLILGSAGPASAATSPRPIAAIHMAEAPHAPTAAPETQTVAATWKFAGIFPDPVTCHLSGIASGYPYTCNWIFVGWTLWLLTD